LRPAFLITTTHHLLAFDGRRNFFRVHSGKGLYYGLAQDHRHVYVSCRNETGGPWDPALRAAESGSILVLDAGSLGRVGELRPEEFALRDVHGIACFDRKLWVTSSWDNLVAVFDLDMQRWTKWYPSPDPDARDRDVNHFNTVVADGEYIRVLAHNNGPSQILTFDRCSLDLHSVMDLGCQAHDVFRVNGEIATCSSIEGLLMGTGGWTIRTGAFPRGLAFAGDIFLGLSQVTSRPNRSSTSGILRRFSSNWRYVADHVLPDVGMILAILPVDVDMSGADLEPFESQYFSGEYNSLEPGNVYEFGGEARSPEIGWHSRENGHRWTAALDARMNIVVNPGERSLVIRAGSAFPGAYSAEILVNGRSTGTLNWDEPGCSTFQLTLPPEACGTCEVVFRVPHLWQPSALLGSADGRMLGVSLQELKIL
jgi:hypothetical protein